MFNCVTRQVLHAKLANPSSQANDGAKVTLGGERKDKNKKCKCG